MILFCDSQSAIHLVWNPIIHAKTKNIEVWYRRTRELITKERLEIWKFDTELNIVNCLTKPLPDNRFKTLTVYMGIQRS